MNDKSYTNWSAMNDNTLLQTIGEFIQHHRLKQNRSQDSVAKAAGISRSTLSLLERGKTTNLSSLIHVLRILDLLYVMDIFKIEKTYSPVEYAKLQKQGRLRANEPTPIYNKKLEW